MGKSGAARAEFNAASAYTQRRKQRKASVAKRLQETRLKCGLKQQDVAERTGINVVTLSGYEIGKNEPNMEALVSLADVYIRCDAGLSHVQDRFLSIRICKTGGPHQHKGPPVFLR